MTARGPYKAKPDPGTVADLIMRFRGSPIRRGWSTTTAAARERVLADFLVMNGRIPVSEIKRGHIVSLRDQLSEHPSAANSWLKCIKVLFGYAVEIEMVAADVSLTVKRLPVPNPDGFRTWREDEISTYLERHRLGTLAHLVFTLALYTGAARCDLVRLGPANIRGDRLVYRRQKTRGQQAPLVDIPVLRHLHAALEGLPAQGTFLETAQGRRRSEKALGGDFHAWVAQAGLDAPDDYGRTLGLHGLRKAMARRLAEAGASPASIMAVLGHKSPAMAAHYAASYDRAKVADLGMEKLGATETNIVRIRKKDADG